MRAGNAIGAAVALGALVGLGIEAMDSFESRPDPAAAVGAGTAPATALIEGFSFTPVTIPVGGEVMWRNADSAPHNVAAQDDSFQSPVLDSGASFTLRFDRPGTFAYVCTLHTSMRGTVEVRDASATPTTTSSNPYGPSKGS